MLNSSFPYVDMIYKSFICDYVPKDLEHVLLDYFIKISTIMLSNMADEIIQKIPSQFMSFSATTDTANGKLFHSVATFNIFYDA